MQLTRFLGCGLWLLIKYFYHDLFLFSLHFVGSNSTLLLNKLVLNCFDYRMIDGDLL